MGSSDGSSSLIVFENTDDSDDRREIEIQVEEQVQEDIAQVEKEAMAVAREAMESLKENEFEDLHESLAKLRENIHKSINVHVDVKGGSGDDFIMMEESFNVSQGGKLEIDIPASDIEIRTTSSDRATLVYKVKASSEDKARDFFEKINLRSSLNGNKILVIGGKRGNFNMSWRNRVKGTAVLTIPERFDVEAKTSGGDIDLGDLEGGLFLSTSGGDINVGDTNGEKATIRTSGGDISTDNVKYTYIKIETSGGDIELNEVEGDEVEVRTSGGDISADEVLGNLVDLVSSGGDLEIENITGKLKARTSGGDIEIGLNGSNEANLRTSGGDIRIVTSSDLSADVKLQSSSVSIDDRLSFDGTKTKRKAEGKINGGGPLLSAQTSGGSIKLRVK